VIDTGGPAFTLTFVHRLAFVFAFLALAGCHHCLRSSGADGQSIVRFTAADAPPVDSGSYPGPLQILPNGDPLAVRAAPLQADVAAHEKILRQLVRERISVKSPLEFQPMFVAQDSRNQKLILRYFSRAADQTVVAGWQAQIVYSLPFLRLEHAYVQAVPLE